MKYIIWLSIFIITFITNTLQAQDWQLQRIERANFQMRFPIKPQVESGTNVVFAKCSHQEITYQSVAYLNRNYNLSNSDALLEESIKGFVNPQTDKIIQKTSVNVFGLQGKDIWITTSTNEKIVFRTLISKDKLFQFVLTRSGGKIDEAIVKRFLDSFALVGK